MALRTKCMNAPPSDSDGLRICVMRNPGVYRCFLAKKFEQKYGRKMYDIHLKSLAPPTALKNAYKHGQLTWDEYEPIFEREVLRKQSELLKIIAFVAQYRDTTLLCSEKTSGHCHRRPEAQECKRYQPGLEIIVE